MRGYFGIAIWQPKTEGNFGGALRSAHAFGAAFVWLIGHRFAYSPANTTKAERHMPVIFSDTMEHFLDSRPQQAQLVIVETWGKHDLRRFTHPAQAIYLLGGEDRTVPEDLCEQSCSVRIDVPLCLNLAVAASLVMYARTAERMT